MAVRAHHWEHAREEERDRPGRGENGKGGQGKRKRGGGGVQVQAPGVLLIIQSGKQEVSTPSTRNMPCSSLRLKIEQIFRKPPGCGRFSRKIQNITLLYDLML
jgi:hypothetical protein